MHISAFRAGPRCDEEERVGTGSGGVPAPIPNSAALSDKSGCLVLPMYQLASGVEAGTVKERRITCTHQGDPVLETVFSLQH